MNWAPYQIWQVRQSSANNWSLNLSSLRLMDQPIPFWAFTWQIPFGEPDLSHFSTGHFPTCKPLCKPSAMPVCGVFGAESHQCQQKRHWRWSRRWRWFLERVLPRLYILPHGRVDVSCGGCVFNLVCACHGNESASPLIQYAFDAYWKQSKWGPVPVGCQSAQELSTKKYGWCVRER